MNRLHQAQERRQPSSTSSVPSFSQWYSNTTGIIRDTLCFAYASSDYQVWDDSSYAYDERKEPIRNCFASYELSGEFEDNWIQHKNILPMQNITRRTHSLLQSSSVFLDEDDDDDDDAPRGQTTTLSRENSCYSIVFLSSAAVHKPLHPPISPCDTNTTVSLSQSMDDDEEDWRSTTSAEVASHLFRPTRNHSLSSKSGGNEDYESYGYLLRMKPENYMHGGDHADEMSGLHMHGGDHADEKSGLHLIRPTYCGNDSFVVRPPCRSGNGRRLAAVAA